MSTVPNDAEPAAALEEGIRWFYEKDLERAHVAFERAHRRAMKDPRAMSWYGVTLVLVEKNSNLGVLYCDQAIRQAGPEPELCLNSARVHLALGQRERTVRAITRGLEHAPTHPGLRAAQTAMGWRRKPVLSFLSRNHVLNRWLGKVRYKFVRMKEPRYELSPVTLGGVVEEPPQP